MIITTNPLCNDTIGAPSDMQDDCSALPVFRHADEHGQWSASFWKPDAAELALLNAGGDVILNVRAAGRQHPVVSVGVVTVEVSESGKGAHVFSSIPTWYDRRSTGMLDSKEDYMLAEIADLRAVLTTKAAHWFACLHKCAVLLELDDDTPIPTGVVDAVKALVAAVPKRAPPTPNVAAIATKGTADSAPVVPVCAINAAERVSQLRDWLASTGALPKDSSWIGELEAIVAGRGDPCY